MNRFPKTAKLLLLTFLYLSQGLPFGFQATALPVYLRANGVSLEAIGFVTSLAAPWMLKPLWAPLVDRYGSARFGRRKSWILPLQGLICITLFFASSVSVNENLELLLLLVFLMNLFAATQDIAVDGLALDLLSPEELGPGNASQVVGYKAGMLISGGVLVWLSKWLSWQYLFMIMGGISLVPFFLILLYSEKESEYFKPSMNETFSGIINKLITYVKMPGELWVVLFIASYKLGEIMIDVMFKPFLIDSGLQPSDVGLILGTWGMVASLLGSLIGGILALRLSLHRALSVSLILRLVPLTCEWIISFTGFSNTILIAVTIFEHLFGGMLTTVMFAFMMSRVNRQIGATHYTVLASVEVIGKTPGAWISGFIAKWFGYPVLFGIGVLISAAVIFILPFLGKKTPQNCKKLLL